MGNNQSMLFINRELGALPLFEISNFNLSIF